MLKLENSIHGLSEMDLRALFPTCRLFHSEGASVLYMTLHDFVV